MSLMTTGGDPQCVPSGRIRNGKSAWSADVVGADGWQPSDSLEILSQARLRRCLQSTRNPEPVRFDFRRRGPDGT